MEIITNYKKFVNPQPRFVRWPRRVVILLFLFLLFSGKSVLAENVLIVEVQIKGEKVSEDFIKIYNPSDLALDVSGYKLRKRSSTGKESSIRVFPKGTKIPAKSYFLWANSQEGYADSIGAQIKSTATLARNNSIALLNPEKKILDALAWGESQNPFIEGFSFPENPGPNQKLKRKRIKEIYQDTDNNSKDFFLDPPLKPAKTETSPKKPQPEKIELPKEEGEEFTLKRELAEAKQIPKSLSVFIIALAIAIFSGVIILILKKRLKN